MSVSSLPGKGAPNDQARPGARPGTAVRTGEAGSAPGAASFVFERWFMAFAPEGEPGRPKVHERGAPGRSPSGTSSILETPPQRLVVHENGLGGDGGLQQAPGRPEVLPGRWPQARKHGGLRGQRFALQRLPVLLWDRVGARIMRVE